MYQKCAVFFFFVVVHFSPASLVVVAAAYTIADFAQPGRTLFFLSRVFTSINILHCAGQIYNVFHSSLHICYVEAHSIVVVALFVKMCPFPRPFFLFDIFISFQSFILCNVPSVRRRILSFFFRAFLVDDLGNEMKYILNVCVV